MVVLLGLVSALLIFGVPFAAGRGLWRLPISLLVRLLVFPCVPAILLWWLYTDPAFHDITNMGAASIPLGISFAWIVGFWWSCVRRVCSGFLRLATEETPANTLMRDQQERLRRMR